MVQNVSIVIPLYTTSLTINEWKSIDRCVDFMGNRYEIILAVPYNLDLTPIFSRYGREFATERFDDEYFKSIDGYNRLMMSTEFYARFLKYEYILIYQADCYIFEDKLEEWCAKGYDYVGAPWISSARYMKRYYQLYMAFRKRFCGKYSRVHLRLSVGNGGFSLRRSSLFHDLTIELQDVIKYYISRKGPALFNEDVFWSIEPNRNEMRMKIPTYNEALSFSFDNHPNVAYAITGGKLPMGCHGWTKKRFLKFYKDKIK